MPFILQTALVWKVQAPSWYVVLFPNCYLWILFRSILLWFFPNFINTVFQYPFAHTDFTFFQNHSCITVQAPFCMFRVYFLGFLSTTRTKWCLDGNAWVIMENGKFSEHDGMVKTMFRKFGYLLDVTDFKQIVQDSPHDALSSTA